MVDVQIIRAIEYNPSWRKQSVTNWEARNLTTGRTVIIKSAAKLRSTVHDALIQLGTIPNGTLLEIEKEFDDSQFGGGVANDYSI
jgi:hypothetical protein